MFNKEAVSPVFLHMCLLNNSKANSEKAIAGTFYGVKYMYSYRFYKPV